VCLLEIYNLLPITKILWPVIDVVKELSKTPSYVMRRKEFELVSTANT